MADLPPHTGPGGPSTAIPMAPCLALLRTFDKDNPTPQQTVAAAADQVVAVLGADALVDLTDGQFAALIDRVAADGQEAFSLSQLAEWVIGGNYYLAGRELAEYGPRGVAERDVWNVGNSL